MILRVAIAAVYCLLSFAAFGQMSGGGPAPGPVSTFQINEYNRTSPGFTDTTGKTTVSCALVGGEKTVVFLVVGQSLAANGNGTTLYAPGANAAKINEINIYDGLCYRLKGPALGTSGSTLDVIWSRLGDNIITAGTSGIRRVIFVPIAMASSTSADWSSGQLYSRIMVAANRMRSVGLPPTAVLMQQGQGDTALGSPDGSTTSSAVYQANWKKAQAILKGSGYDVPWLVAVDTMVSSNVNATIAGAQAALVNNGENRYVGPNIDGLTGANRLGDGTHLSDTGLAAAATTGAGGWQTAIANMGF